MLATLHTFLPMADKIRARKPSLDILKYICVANQQIMITDLETTLCMPIQDKRRYTLPFQAMKKILATNPASLSVSQHSNEKITIAFDGKQLTLPSPVTEEYPEQNEHGFVKMGVWSRDVFRQLYKQTVFASSDMLRPALTGVYIMQKQQLSSVATNGHIMQWIEDLDYDKACELLHPFSAVLPAAAVRKIGRFVRADTIVYRSENAIRFVMKGKIEFTIRRIKETFPDFEKVLPDLTDSLVIDKAPIQSCIKSAIPFSNPNTHKASFTAGNGNLHLQVNDMDEQSSFQASLPIAKRSGRELNIDLNLELLEKIINSLDDTPITWLYGTADDPVIMTDGKSVRNLIMPIRSEN